MNVAPTHVVSFAFLNSRHSVFALPESAVKAATREGEARFALAFADSAVMPSSLEQMAPEQIKVRPASRGDLCLAAVSVAEAHDLPAPFFANLIQQESGFKPHAVSPVGAQGIAQFMPRTARAYGLENPFDPFHALSASARFLRELVGQFGNLGLAAAAYNAGPRRVIDWMARRGNLPEETRNYVRSITGRPAEQWANLRKSEDMTLPPHARCPGGIIATREARADEPSASMIKIADAAKPAIRAAAKGHKARRIVMAAKGKAGSGGGLGKPAQIAVAEVSSSKRGKPSGAGGASRLAAAKSASKVANARGGKARTAEAKRVKVAAAR